MNVAIGTSRKRQTSNSLRVCVSMPFAASITITAESTAVSVRYVSSEKSSWPGVSRKLNTRPPYSKVMTEVTTEIPRSRSIAIQSERVDRRSRLALTCPASWIAPPNSRSFSVKVVLPASGWEMIAKVRRRPTSAAMGDGVSAPNEVRRGIFMAGWMWQFARFRSRPGGFRFAGKFFTQDLELKPLLLCRGDIVLELCERDGGSVEGGPIPRIEAGIVEFRLECSDFGLE